MQQSNDWTVAQQRIRENFDSFERLVAQAENHLASRRDETAAVYTQLAADFAWCNHSGLFASGRLERILMEIGKRCLPYNKTERKKLISKSNKSGDTLFPRSVLHVLTEAYQVGGHTRLAWRWIELDKHRTHSVALTRQAGTPTPLDLQNAVDSVNGKTFRLDEKPGGVIARARALRNLAQNFDCVVLHIHPYDVVPLLAFANRQSHLPVIFMNHADHVFWIGVSVIDIIAQFRTGGSLAVTQQRRGIEPERCALLPIPLSRMERDLSRAEAKSRLGLSESAVVLLTVASAYKFQTGKNLSYVDTVLPVLQKYENAVLLAVGPSPEGEWQRGEEQTGGRLKAVGTQNDPSLFYQAADILVDSLPFNSMTSVLDAGGYGVPTVQYHIYSGEASLFNPSDIAFDDNVVVVHSVQDFQSAVGELIENKDKRQQIGERTRNSVTATHMGDGWRRYLEDLYARANTLPPRAYMPLIKETPCMGELDTTLSLVHEYSNYAPDYNLLFRRNYQLLPLGERFSVWLNSKEKIVLRRSLVLPETLGMKLHKRSEKLWFLLSWVRFWKRYLMN